MPNRLATTVIAIIACGSLAGAVTEMPQGSPANFTGQGNTALMREQFDSAIALYQKALDINKGYYYALYNLALTHQHVGILTNDPEERRRHFEQARRKYTEALQQRPDSSEAMCNLGIIAFHLQEYGVAAGHFAKAADQSTKPTEIAEYAYNLGTAQERRQQWRDAEEAYLRAIRLNNDHFGANFNLGTLYLRQLDNQPKAEEHLLRAREIDPKRPEPLLNLAVLAENRDHLLQADQLYSEAVRVASLHRPEQEVVMRWHRGRFYWRSDIPGKATKIAMKQDLLSILEREPDYPEANGLLGRYYESIAEYAQAIHFLEREVSEANFDPNSEVDLMSHFLLATIYSEHLKNSAKALEHVRAYYELRPDQTGDELRRSALRQQERDQTDTEP
ncbi:MAG: tetratricopeptide repeat protein [Planctomycetota bacterium]|nr:tetratricopeptide repeat protein [Planctomycetota bacterium]